MSDIREHVLDRLRARAHRPAERRWPSALARVVSGPFDPDAEALPPIDHVAALRGLVDDGVAYGEALFTADRCAHLYREILRQLDSAARPEFGDIHGKGQRLDLPLRLTTPVAEALVLLAHRLAPVLRARLGDDATLVELSALQALPGAPEQPPHPDAAHSDAPDEARLVTVFVLLADVTPERGPLEVWPGSHALPVSSRDRAAVLARPSRRMTGPTGAAVVMDARTWHRGTANTGPAPRPVFYATWMSAGKRPDGPTWSLHASVPSSLPLDALSLQQRQRGEEGHHGLEEVRQGRQEGR